MYIIKNSIETKVKIILLFTFILFHFDIENGKILIKIIKHLIISRRRHLKDGAVQTVPSKCVNRAAHPIFPDTIDGSTLISQNI